MQSIDRRRLREGVRSRANSEAKRRQSEAVSSGRALSGRIIFVYASLGFKKLGQKPKNAFIFEHRLGCAYRLVGGGKRDSIAKAARAGRLVTTSRDAFPRRRTWPARVAEVASDQWRTVSDHDLSSKDGEVPSQIKGFSYCSALDSLTAMPVSTSRVLRGSYTDRNTGIPHILMFALDDFHEVFLERSHGRLVGARCELFYDLAMWLVFTPEINKWDPDTYACMMDLHLDKIMLDILARDDYYDEDFVSLSHIPVCCL